MTAQERSPAPPATRALRPGVTDEQTKSIKECGTTMSGYSALREQDAAQSHRGESMNRMNVPRATPKGQAAP